MKKKKLQLGKTTIMNLNQPQAAQVKGGRMNMDQGIGLFTFDGNCTLNGCTAGRCTDGCTDGCSPLQTEFNCTKYQCTRDCGNGPGH